jgi:hypothetical protein
MTTPDSWPPGRRDPANQYRDHAEGDHEEWQRHSRLQRRDVERRQAARRRRRIVVLSLLLVAAALAGVDFALAGIASPDPSDVEARSKDRYVNSPDPAHETPSPSPSASPSPSGKPDVPYSGSGKFDTAPGQSDVMGTGGGLLRYRVRVEQDSHQDPAEFADFVDATLGDERSWIAGGDVRLQRVSTGSYDFTIFLATPATVDQLCSPLPTDGFTSCRQGDNVVINLARWVLSVPHWDSDLDAYRRYAVNHEVGHRLGHGHELCLGKGKLAPVMQQQTLTLHGCKGNSWPYVDGKRYAGQPGTYN